MDKYLIDGGKPLSGSVKAMASKNSTLPILAAALLPENGISEILDIPNLRDIDVMLKVLQELGAKVEWDKESKKVLINAENYQGFEAPYDLVRKMRASFLVLGALVGRQKQAKVSLPGGCSLGQRPVGLHLKALSSLGVTVREEVGYVIAEGQIKGGTAFFDRPSHTGTENIMLAAAISNGTTRIVNAACDPEVIDVANFLNKMGAKISGAGTNVVVINGVDKLTAVKYTPMPDRLEVGTFLCMAAATGGEIIIENAQARDMEIVLQKLSEMGCEINSTDNSISLKSTGKLVAADFLTYPYPGFPTDLQACFVALSTIAVGTSHIRETIYDDRFSHCMELVRLGADINITGDVAVVSGVSKLNGTAVMASDIRAGAGLLTACLAAKGKSEVRRIYHIERGYDQIDKKLRSVGASIEKVPD